MTETNPDMVARAAEIAHLPAFLRGEWCDIPTETLDDLFATAAYDFALDHDDATLKRARTISLSPSWSKENLLDAVMICGYALETPELSVSRLGKAARFLGFSVLTPYAAAVCYFRFKSLKEEYKCKKKTTTNRSAR